MFSTEVRVDALTLTFIVVAVICTVGWLITIAIPKPDSPPYHTQPHVRSIVLPGGTTVSESQESRSRTDDAFKAHMDELAEKFSGAWFHAKVAGVSYRNEDGSSRQALIRRLKPFDFLNLVPEPDNPFDKNAIRVLTNEGDQIGFLDQRLAGEVTRAMSRGTAWLAAVAHLNSSAEHKTQGVVIGVMKFKPRDEPE